MLYELIGQLCQIKLRSAPFPKDVISTISHRSRSQSNAENPTSGTNRPYIDYRIPLWSSSVFTLKRRERIRLSSGKIVFVEIRSRRFTRSPAYPSGSPLFDARSNIACHFARLGVRGSIPPRGLHEMQRHALETNMSSSTSKNGRNCR